MSANFRAIIVIGPTASGKTALAHALADGMHARGMFAELVNLDAFQIYRGVSAGTAKPSQSEIDAYRYHGIDIVEPDSRVDAQMFAKMTGESCADIFARGGVPIAVGGSGLYLRAFLHGLDALPEKDESVRQFLRSSAERWGWPHLHEWLRVVDATRAQELHPNDGVRIERALEIFFLTGAPPSRSRTRTESPQQQSSLFDSFVIQVGAEDSVLRERIFTRVPKLLEAGWVDELCRLRARFGDALPGLQCMKAIGYRELFDSLDRLDDEALRKVTERIATLTWQYARRQRVWNAKERCDCHFSHERDSLEETVEKIVGWWNGV